MKPSVPLLNMLHCGVEFIQELVTQHLVVNHIPLSSGIMERAVVASAREIQPFLNISQCQGGLVYRMA
jgi:hypothetical protein